MFWWKYATFDENIAFFYCHLRFLKDSYVKNLKRKNTFTISLIKVYHYQWMEGDVCKACKDGSM